MLNELEIIKIAQNGENSLVEFKNDSVDNKKLAKELIAFSNHKGGMLFLGIEDDCGISGMSRKDNEERIMNICTDLIRPVINPVYYEVSVEDNNVGIIEIENGSNKPYYLEDKALKQKNFFMRYGSTTRELKHRDELQRLFQSSQNIHYEIIPAAYSSMDDFDIQEAETFVGKLKNKIRADRDIQVVLKNLELLVDAGGELKPSVAGMILFGKSNIKSILPQSKIMCAKIDGTKITDNKEDILWCESNAFRNFDSAFSFFMKYNKHSFEISGKSRKDTFDYPESAFRELLVNAIIHRDYTISGSEIQIWIFEDRIEIKSPGSIPNTLSIEKMKFGAKYHRNPVLAQFFAYAGLAEMMGQGIPMVDKWLKENGNPELRIYEDENELKFVLRKI